jgi:inorganic phosphate transporter, PiT family
MTLVLIVVFVALVFEYINGFHDTANSIAMGVSTRALTPRAALTLAALMNLVGALVGTAVAKTISSGLLQDGVIPKSLTSYLVISALMGAIVWNLITWWFGLPSSSSHALVGGVVGAALAASHGDFGSIIWYAPGKDHVDAITHVVTPAAWYEATGVIGKVIIPMILSPFIGFFGGLLIMSVIYAVVAKWRPGTVDRTFRFGQLFSGGYMGFSHGSNDAQKTMGVIALALYGATEAGHLNDLPQWAEFLRIDKNTDFGMHIPVWAMAVSSIILGGVIFGLVWAIADNATRASKTTKATAAIIFGILAAVGTWFLIKNLGHANIPLDKKTGLPDYKGAIPIWIKISCAFVMAAGTAAGGWRIIKTMGQKMVKVLPVNGFTADATAASVLAIAASYGMPVSTTHAITTSIMGVGCARRWSALKLSVIARILTAWVLTLPLAAVMGWLIMKCCLTFGGVK